MSVKEITLCGGGNGIHAFAPIALERGLRVNIWAPYGDEAYLLKKGAEEEGGIRAVFTDRSIIKMPHRISSRAPEVIPGADLIVIITPAFVHRFMLGEIYPLIGEKASIVVIPSRSGLEYEYLSLGFAEEVNLTGFQTLPWACRIEEYGRKVRIFGIKEYQAVASIAEGPVDAFYRELEELIGVKIKKMESFLSLTLGNMGQLIHPGIMYGIINRYGEKEFAGDEIPLFYQGVDDSTARILEGLSSELLLIRDHIASRGEGLHLADVPSLKEWLISSYGDEIEDKGSLRAVFNTNRVYRGLKVPVVEGDGGRYHLDKGTRYVREDLPYGLLVSKGIAVLCGLKTPVMDEVITVLQNWLGKEYTVGGDLRGRDIGESRIPQNYGLESLDDLIGAIL